jgi:hypothetical protein
MFPLIPWPARFRSLPSSRSGPCLGRCLQCSAVAAPTKPLSYLSTYSRDKGNHSPKPPRAPVHAALARGGLDQGAYFTSERAHCEKFAAKGLDRTTTTSRPEKRVFLRLTDKGLEAKKSPIPIRRMVELGLKAKGK